MKMQRTRAIALLLGLVLLTAQAWAGGRAERRDEAAGTPIVVTSFTVLQDLTRMVSGDLLDVRTITPVGGELHEWELIPSNFQDLEMADLVLVNGLELEEWMPQVLATARPGIRVVEVADESGFPTIPIRIGELTGSPDPHAWMNPDGAIAYLHVILAELSQLAPQHRATFEANAERARTEIQATAQQLRREFEALPLNR